MKSYLLDKYSAVPATRRSVNKLVTENSVFRMTGVTLVAITDNSTGVAANGWKEVPIARGKFTHVNAALDLSLSSDFYVVAGKLNNAIAVLKTAINAVLSKVSDPSITGGNGTVATPGTVPACEKTVDGTAGATALVISRAEGNARLALLRDNLSTLLLAYNRCQRLFDRPTQPDYGTSDADNTLVLKNLPAAGAAITNTGDCMSKASTDAAFAQMVDNVAKLSALFQSLQAYIDVRV